MKNKFLLLLLLSISTLFIKISAQTSVGISAAAVGSFTPNPAAILDISSTTLGLLVPQISNSNLPTTLVAPAPGLLFFNTTATVPFLYLNTSATVKPNWIALSNNSLTNTLSFTGTVLNSTIVNGATTSIAKQDLSAILPAITNSWNLTGNTIVTGNFLGTSNSKDVVLAANNVERMRILSTGNIGIGTATPLSTLEIGGFIGSNITKDPTTISLTTPCSILYFSVAQSSPLTLNIPAASACSNRRYLIVNVLSTAFPITPGYLSKTGSSISVTQIAAYSSIEIISDGNNWYQIY